MEGVVTHDFRFRLEEPTKKENQQVTAVKAPNKFAFTEKLVCGALLVLFLIIFHVIYF